MKNFDSVTEALREVKKLSNEMDRFDSVFLVYNDYHENYLVSEDNYEIQDLIEERWHDSACELDPDREADEYKVWEYYLAESKDKWPSIFRSSKRSLIKGEKPLIRIAKQVSAECSVNFTIN